MSDLKISQMEKATALVGDELIPTVQNGLNKTTSVTLLRQGLATESWVENTINTIASTTIIKPTLPERGEINKIYLIPNSSSRANDVYDEYIWLTESGWEYLGNKQVTVDMTNYYTKAQVDDLITALRAELKPA